MSKKKGIVLVIIGAVLMISALLFFLYNRQEDLRAGQRAELLLEEIHTAINSDTAELEENETSDSLPVIRLEDYEYIGYLSIPNLGLELPVMSQWSYELLQIAPCRHIGSPKTDDLVIAAHNYKTHFKGLSKLDLGSEISFTDMNGQINIYTLSKIETLPADAVDAVLNSGYDLVLYTCTSSGSSRVAAFCQRADIILEQ